MMIPAKDTGKMHPFFLTFLDAATEERYTKFSYITSGFYGGKIWHFLAFFINVFFFIYYHGIVQGFNEQMFFGKFWVGLFVNTIINVLMFACLFIERLYEHREKLYLLTLFTHWPSYLIMTFFGMGKPWPFRYAFTFGCLFFCTFVVQARFSRAVIFLVVSPVLTLIVTTSSMTEYWSGISVLEIWFWVLLCIPSVTLRLFERTSRRAFVKMEKCEDRIDAVNLQIERTEDLIVSFFAKTPTRDFLADGKRAVRSRRYPDTTMIVTDMAGFTAWTSRSKPNQVIAALSRMFATMDLLSLEYDVEKVSTVGDCFQGAVFPSETEKQQRASNAVEFGTRILNTGGECELRIGVHIGLVTAAFIGNKPPKFDLFGEAFDRAKEMESAGVIGKVHVTNEVLEAIGDYAHPMDEPQKTALGVCFTEWQTAGDNVQDEGSVAEFFSVQEVYNVCQALIKMGGVNVKKAAATVDATGLLSRQETSDPFDRSAKQFSNASFDMQPMATFDSNNSFGQDEAPMLLVQQPSIETNAEATPTTRGLKASPANRPPALEDPDAAGFTEDYFRGGSPSPSPSNQDTNFLMAPTPKGGGSGEKQRKLLAATPPKQASPPKQLPMFAALPVRTGVESPVSSPSGSSESPAQTFTARSTTNTNASSNLIVSTVPDSAYDSREGVPGAIASTSSYPEEALLKKRNDSVLSVKVGRKNRRGSVSSIASSTGFSQRRGRRGSDASNLSMLRKSPMKYKAPGSASSGKSALSSVASRYSGMGSEEDVAMNPFLLEFKDPHNEMRFGLFLKSTGLVQKCNVVIVVMEMAMLVAYVFLCCIDSVRNRLLMCGMMMLLFGYVLLLIFQIQLPKWTLLTIVVFSLIATLAAFTDSGCTESAKFYTPAMVCLLAQNTVLVTQFMLDNKLLHRVALNFIACCYGQVLFMFRIFILEDENTPWDPVFLICFLGLSFVSFFADYTLRASYASDLLLSIVLRRMKGKQHETARAALSVMLPDFVSQRLLSQKKETEANEDNNDEDDDGEAAGGALDMRKNQLWDFDAVCVMFVNFTPDIEDIAQQLDTINATLDTVEGILSAGNIHKIKTIGSTLMCVSGIDGAKDCVPMMAHAAIEIVSKVFATNPGWKYTIGIHYGSCFGAVLGTRSMIFDIFGDTVNLASRMGSTARQRTIQVTERVARKCTDEPGLALLKNEPVYVKGKGQVQTFSITSL